MRRWSAGPIGTALLALGCTSTVAAVDAHVASDAFAVREDAWREPDADRPRCTSGMLWDEALAPSEEMHPGRACIQCHIDENSASGEGDAPIFGAAGTVFPSAHEPDDCLATSTAGAIVTLTDATGTRYPLEVSVNGNFLVEDPAFLAPYIAEISFEGRVRSMVGAQTNGDCNACHTADGDHDAPGRIALP